MRRLLIIVGLASLTVGPWSGLAEAKSVPSLLTSPPGGSFPMQVDFLTPDTGFGADPQVAAFGGGGMAARSAACTCRTISVDATNIVRDAEIRTGDATVENSSVTYVAGSWDETDVEVEQEATAITGDAIAGQILSVVGEGGCTNVIVRALNVVENSQVRSGDATATNRSVVLLDPSLETNELDIDIDQEAEARSGRAIAGQIISAAGGGPCGGVDVDAQNRLKNVDLGTGRALTDNASDIVRCEQVGCADELAEFAGEDGAVEVCFPDGCRLVPADEVAAALADAAEEAEEAEETPAPEEEEYPHSGEYKGTRPPPTPKPPPGPQREPQR